jgi:hypothetical protein
MTREPDFRELVGEDLPTEEAARLRHVHDLLLEAGPPPELPRSLAVPAIEVSERPAREHQGMFQLLPRRRLGAALALAATVALVAFVGGYVAGYRHHPAASKFATEQTVRLHGTALDPDAVAVVRVGHEDANGNLPMLVTAEHLTRLPRNGYYTLALTKNGRPVVSCGTFRVRSDQARTTVRMAVAYDVTEFDGWVVTEYRHGRKAEPVVLKS